MKILMIFVDMLRPNRFNVYNDKIKPNQIDDLVKNLGATLYTNCYSPAPDTPRSMAAFHTGKLPFENGCDSRVKWPRKFLDNSLDTIYDEFIKQNYKMTFFSNPNERKTGLFPQKIDDMDIHNDDFDMDGYLSNVKLEEDHLVFVSIPDYHWALQDWRYSVKGEQKALLETRKSLDIVFKNLPKDEFDHIFIFSDHGFKFSIEKKREPMHEFINRDRSNIFMLHRSKNQNNIKYNDKLCSILDMKDTIDDIFAKENLYSLFSKNEREYVIVEDHFSTGSPTVNQNIDMWGMVTKEFIYVRTLDKAVTIDMDSKILSQDVVEQYDDTLKKESQFGRYYDEYEKVFMYRNLVLKQTMHMNSRSRLDFKKNILQVIFWYFLDYFKKFD